LKSFGNDESKPLLDGAFLLAKVAAVFFFSFSPIWLAIYTGAILFQDSVINLTTDLINKVSGMACAGDAVAGV